VTLICILGDTREVSHVQGPVLSWAHAYTTTLLFARMEVHSKRNVQRVPNPQTRGTANSAHPYGYGTIDYLGRSEPLFNEKLTDVGIIIMGLHMSIHRCGPPCAG